MATSNGRFVIIGLRAAAVIAGAALLLCAASAAAQAPAPTIESRPLGVPAPSGGLRIAGDAGSAWPWWVRTAVALAVVLALIALTRAALLRIAAGRGGLASLAGARAPSGVLEVLGRFPVARGQTLLLLRMDRRVILIGQTPDGFRTLSEVTDADEVASLLVKTRDEEGASSAQRFNDLLREMERDPAVAEDAGPIPAAGLRIDHADGAGPGPLDAIRRRLSRLGLEAPPLAGTAAPRGGRA